MSLGKTRIPRRTPKWEQRRWREKMGENGKEGILNAQLWTKEIVVYSRFRPSWRVGGSSYVYLALQHTASLFFFLVIENDCRHDICTVFLVAVVCSTVHKTLCGKKGWVCNFLLFLLLLSSLRFCLAGNGRYKTGEEEKKKGGNWAQRGEIRKNVKTSVGQTHYFQKEIFLGNYHIWQILSRSSRLPITLRDGCFPHFFECMRGREGREGVEPFAHWSHFGRGGEWVWQLQWKRGESQCRSCRCCCCCMCTVQLQRRKKGVGGTVGKGGIRSRKGWTNFDGDPSPPFTLARKWMEKGEEEEEEEENEHRVNENN